MSTFDQKGQQVQNQINIAGDINIQEIRKETQKCSECGKISYVDEVYQCKRCDQFFCNIHRVNAKTLYCPKCSILVDAEKSLLNSNDDVRRAAAQRIWSVRDKSTIPALMQRIRVEEDAITKHWLYSALGRIGGDDAYKILKKAQTQESDAFILQGIHDGLKVITTVSHFDK